MDTRRVPPAKDLVGAYRACSLLPLPPDHSWYVDLGPAREGNLRPALARRFRHKPSPDQGLSALEVWPKVLFLGMRGSGKSTELRALAASLRDRFEVVWIEADTRLNAASFDLAELILAIAVEVERHLRESALKPLDERLLAELQDWYATVTHESVEERKRSVEVSGGAKIPGAALFFGSAMALLKSTSTEREKVVSELRRFPGDLVALCNRLLRAAEARLGDDRELLLIVDNIDRYPPEVVDRALGGGSDHLLALEVSMLLTPPVDLLVRPVSQPLSTVYATEVMHVPTIRRADDPPGTLADPGHRLLRDLLARRFDVEALLDPKVEDVLIRLSGGHPRLLLELTREAILREEKVCLGHAAVEAAVLAQLTVLRDQVNSSGLTALLQYVYKHGQIGPEEGFLRLLFNRWIFKHDGEDWYSVNPLVLRVPEVKRAITSIGAP
jgi:hypothetical protein